MNDSRRKETDENEKKKKREYNSRGVVALAHGLRPSGVLWGDLPPGRSIRPDEPRRKRPDANGKREYTHPLRTKSRWLTGGGDLYDQMSLAEKGRTKMKNGNILTSQGRRRAGSRIEGQVPMRGPTGTYTIR